MTVDESDRDLLVKLLRMFSSDFDGEVAAAARKVHGLMVSRHLDWDDLIIKRSGQQQRDGYRHDHQRGYQRYEPPPPPPPPPRTEEQIIARCAQFMAHLNPFECEFITSISASLIQWGELTPRQKAVLERIVIKLRLRGVY